MSDEKLLPEQESERKYRQLLRDCLLDVSEQFLREHQEEIVKMAEARVKLLLEVEKE